MVEFTKCHGGNGTLPWSFVRLSSIRPPTAMYVRAGPAKALPERLIGNAPLNNTYFHAIFLHGVSRIPTNRFDAIPFYFFFFFKPGYVTDPTVRKNEQVTIKSHVKQKKKQERNRDGTEYNLHLRFEWVMHINCYINCFVNPGTISTAII